MLLILSSLIPVAAAMLDIGEPFAVIACISFSVVCLSLAAANLFHAAGSLFLTKPCLCASILCLGFQLQSCIRLQRSCPGASLGLRQQQCGDGQRTACRRHQYRLVVVKAQQLWILTVGFRLVEHTQYPV